jgi:hypothetical protein
LIQTLHLLSNRSIYSSAGRLSEQFSGSQAALPSKQLLESKAAIGKAGTSFLKRVTGIVFTVNKEARRTLILDGLDQTIARDCTAHQGPYKMHWFDF